MTLREFRLPDLGEGLTESDIVAWRIAEGDAVELNQIIAEVETAKALVELPSPYAGVVAELHAREGETVNVGDPLVTFAVTAPAPSSTTEDDAPEPNLVGYGARPEHAGRPVRRARRVPAGVVPAAPVVRRDRAERPHTARNDDHAFRGVRPACDRRREVVEVVKRKGDRQILGPGSPAISCESKSWGACPPFPKISLSPLS